MPCPSLSPSPSLGLALGLGYICFPRLPLTPPLIPYASLPVPRVLTPACIHVRTSKSPHKHQFLIVFLIIPWNFDETIRFGSKVSVTSLVVVER